jgi:two-component system, chemotaxis family, sensor kinase CheA
MPPDDPYKYFRIEAAEIALRLGQGALDIGQGAAITGGVAALLRHAHTLKGAARVVKQIAIANHAHALEDVLGPYRSENAAVPRECARLLLEQIDAISALLERLDDRGPTRAKPAPAGPSPGREPEITRTVRCEVGEVDAVIDGLGEALVELETLRRSLKGVAETRRLAELCGRQLAAPRRGDAQKLSLALDQAQRQTEELETALLHIDRGLRQSLERLGRELGQTHAAAERLRLVQATSIFGPLERTAHDAAEELGKRVTFTASGGEVKLDGYVLGVAQNALLHVVRNAVVHGLEASSVRHAAGKPPAGSVRVGVSRRGREVVFTCRDDGQGLDVEGVRRALTQTGDTAHGLSDEALLERLLRTRVSTAGSVTRLAGRGIGLDVLREAADTLGGSVQLGTRPGLGFSVELRLPLSLAAVSAVVAVCGGQTLAIPLDAVVESVRFEQSQIARTAAHESVSHAGQALPFAPLSRVLGVAASGSPRAWSCLIVRSESGTVAVGVDRLLGVRLLVLRALPDAARATSLVSGATLDALGNPELVLDAEGLVLAVQRLSGAQSHASRSSVPILIVDDSLTTRMLEQSILESAGYEVELATSGEEGLAKARLRAYALFLVDVEMPGIDGFTFVDRARSDPDLAGVPAVLVSSRCAPEDFARGKSAGARGYIVKDRFDQRELLGLIQELVGV